MKQNFGFLENKACIFLFHYAPQWSPLQPKWPNGAFVN
jgi:hypothetical protein